MRASAKQKTAAKKDAQQKAFEAVYHVINNVTTKDDHAGKLIDLGKALQAIGESLKGLDLYTSERVINAAAALCGIDDEQP